MFVIELAVPFLIFAPRRLRFAGCALLVFLQVIIFLTGNYCFLKLLTLALCVLLLDDALLNRLTPKKWRKPGSAEEAAITNVRNAGRQSPWRNHRSCRTDPPQTSKQAAIGPLWVIGTFAAL